MSFILLWNMDCGSESCRLAIVWCGDMSLVQSDFLFYVGLVTQWGYRSQYHTYYKREYVIYVTAR
jgi:hypothetical protein